MPSYPHVWVMTSMSWGKWWLQWPSLAAPSGSGQQRPMPMLSLRPDAAIDPWLGDLWKKIMGLYPVPLDFPEIPLGVP